jgi:hypothetical protein
MLIAFVHIVDGDTGLNDRSWPYVKAARCFIEALAHQDMYCNHVGQATLLGILSSQMLVATRSGQCFNFCQDNMAFASHTRIIP